MKKILGLAFGLMIGALSYGQSAATFTENLDNYDKAATTVFHFTIDQSIPQETLNESAVYYTDYFTVDVNDNGNGNDVVITLAQNDEISRQVVQRYLVTIQLQSVNVDGAEVPLNDFVSTYIYL